MYVCETLRKGPAQKRGPCACTSSAYLLLFVHLDHRASTEAVAITVVGNGVSRRAKRSIEKKRFGQQRAIDKE